nr:MAG TPA: hypothetical protein [Caudoviricetes sp.]
MQDTKTIQLPSGGEAVLRTAITNRTRKEFAKAKDDIDLAIELGLKAVLLRYKDADGSDAAYEALMDSTSGEDFNVISESLQEILDPKSSPKG